MCCCCLEVEQGSWCVGWAVMAGEAVRGLVCGGTVVWRSWIRGAAGGALGGGNG